MIWRNEKFPFLNKGIQLVWFHLMTTPSGTPLGLVYGSAESLASELRQTARWYRKRLNEGEQAGLWKYDDTNHVVYLTDYWTQPQNRPNNPNILTSWLKYIDEIPESPLRADCYTDIEKCCTALGDGYVEALKEVAGKFTRVSRSISNHTTETSPECYLQGIPEGSQADLSEGSLKGSSECSSEGSLEGLPEGSSKVRRIQETETDTETEKNKSICAEASASALSSPPPPPGSLFEIISKSLPEPKGVFCELQCTGAKPVYPVTEAYLTRKQALFPSIDIKHETLKAAEWLRDNPKRQKTYNGIMPFLWHWYTKAQHDARASPRANMQVQTTSDIEEEPLQNPFADLMEAEPPEEWIQALESIRESVSGQCFDTWFRPVFYGGIESGVLELIVPSNLFRIGLEENFKPLLLQSTGADDVNFSVANYCN